VVEARHHEHDVDVGRDDLLGGERPRHLARQARAAREDGLDQRRPVARGQPHRDPVADGGEVGLLLRAMPEAAGQLRAAFTLRRPHDEGAAVNGDHPRGRGRTGVRGPVPGDTPALIPSSVFESSHGPAPSLT
jgi:hypothetical protein